MRSLSVLLAVFAITGCIVNEGGRTIVTDGISGPGWTFNRAEIDALSANPIVVRFDDRIHGNDFRIDFQSTPSATIAEGAEQLRAFAENVCARPPYAGLTLARLDHLRNKPDQRRFTGHCRRLNTSERHFIQGLREQLSDVPGFKMATSANWSSDTTGHARIVFFPSEHVAPASGADTFIPFKGDPEDAPSLQIIKKRVAAICSGDVYTSVETEDVTSGCRMEGWGGRKKQGVKCATYTLQCAYDRDALLATYAPPPWTGDSNS